jgi:sporulation protein YlmC with PRC-barrel domain
MTEATVWRVSDLLGRAVVTPDGRRVGRVSGIRCVHDGPVTGVLALPRVESLVLHRHRVGAFLGYQFREQSRPVMLGWLLDWVHRDTILVPLDEIESLGTDPIVRTTA